MQGLLEQCSHILQPCGSLWHRGISQINFPHRLNPMPLGAGAGAAKDATPSPEGFEVSKAGE